MHPRLDPRPRRCLWSGLPFVVAALLPFSTTAAADRADFHLSCDDLPNQFHWRPFRIDDEHISLCDPNDDDPESECRHVGILRAIHARPDLNGDGTPDYIYILNGGGMVSNPGHLNVYSGYVACADGSMKLALADALTRIEVTDQRDALGFAVLRVTRECDADTQGSAVRREYTLRFNTRSRQYGPPDGIDALADYCGAYEQSLPGEPVPQ